MTSPEEGTPESIPALGSRKEVHLEKILVPSTFPTKLRPRSTMRAGSESSPAQIVLLYVVEIPKYDSDADSRSASLGSVSDSPVNSRLAWSLREERLPYAIPNSAQPRKRL